MNIEQILKESVNEIKSKWTLPQSGFLAGGSIGNLAWEKVSGNKAVINDLDIYYLETIIDKAEEELNAAWMAASEEMYKAGAGGSNDNAAGQQQNAGANEHVADAEYEEVK